MYLPKVLLYGAMYPKVPYFKSNSIDTHNLWIVSSLSISVQYLWITLFKPNFWHTNGMGGHCFILQVRVSVICKIVREETTYSYVIVLVTLIGFSQGYWIKIGRCAKISLWGAICRYFYKEQSLQDYLHNHNQMEESPWVITYLPYYYYINS